MSVCGDSLLRLVVDVGREAGMLRTSWRVISLIVGRVGGPDTNCGSLDRDRPSGFLVSFLTDRSGRPFLLCRGIS